MEKITIIIIIWIALGIHSCYFLIKRYTKHYDFTASNIPMLVVCFLLPIVTHIATLTAYPNPKSKENVLFKKRGQ
jgi:hypothetical protein